MIEGGNPADSKAAARWTAAPKSADPKPADPKPTAPHPAAPHPATPIPGSETDALFEGWSSYRRIALAVSGGADSMAMMLLARDWLCRADNPPTLFILTVDHALRPEAADEAAWVKTQAVRLGLEHKTLIWTGAKPSSDVQATARSARYGLLLAACRDAGIEALATAHTADDQAETVLMRLARGSGTDGLAGIPPVSMRGGIGLLRPLLNVPRSRLAASLRDRGETWIEDPGNRDSHYERVRLRAGLKASPALGLTPESVALSAKRLHRARLALEAMTDAFLRDRLRIHPAGYGELDLAEFAQAPEEIGVRVLAGMAEMFGGGQRAIRLARLEALHRTLTQGRARASTPASLAKSGPAPEVEEVTDARRSVATQPTTACLGGCIFTVKRGTVQVTRECGRIDAARLPMDAGTPLLWDRRFIVSASGGVPVSMHRATDTRLAPEGGSPGEADDAFSASSFSQIGLTVGPLGPDGAALLRAAGGKIALPARIAYALPAIRRDEKLAFAPFATFAKAPPIGWIANATATFAPVPARQRQSR